MLAIGVEAPISHLWSECERLVHRFLRHTDTPAKDVGPLVQRGVIQLKESPRLQHGSKNAFLAGGHVNSAEHLGSQDVRAAECAIEPILAQFPIEIAVRHSTSHSFIQEVSLTTNELVFTSDMIVPDRNQIAGEDMKPR